MGQQMAPIDPQQAAAKFWIDSRTRAHLWALIIESQTYNLKSIEVELVAGDRILLRLTTKVGINYLP